MIKVMFVCLGNICRSPMAEFVLKDMVNRKGLSNEFYIKSSATSYEEIGNDIYVGTRNILIQNNIPFTKRKATRLTPEDYNKYDFIIGMEEANIRDIKRIVGEDKEDFEFSEIKIMIDLLHYSKFMEEALYDRYVLQ